MAFEQLLKDWIELYADCVGEFKCTPAHTVTIRRLLHDQRGLQLSPDQIESLADIQHMMRDFSSIEIDYPLQVHWFTRGSDDQSGHRLGWVDSTGSKRVVVGRGSNQRPPIDLMGKLTAFLAGMTLMVDPVPYRICFTKVYDMDASERLQSSKVGGLFVYESGIRWTDKVDDAGIWDIGSAASFHFKEVEFYNVDSIFHPQSHAASRKHFALSFYLAEEVVTFYPLLDTDLAHLLKMLIAYYKRPMANISIVKTILEEKLKLVRLLSVLFLMQQERPYIEHYHDLKAVVRRLSSKEDSIYELERLFHSCKREPTVLVETFGLLKARWHGANDSSKLRILTIVDRLLDPILITSTTDIFKDLYKWLCELEESINPYKNDDLYQAVTSMLARMRGRQGKLWVTRSDYDLSRDFFIVEEEYFVYESKGLWK